MFKSGLALLIFSVAVGAMALGLVWISPDPMPHAHVQLLNVLVALIAASGLGFLAIISTLRP
jgi:hypothetical protein